MFRRTKASLGIESLEKRELLAADLLALGPDPAGVDAPGQVTQIAVSGNFANKIKAASLDVEMLDGGDQVANGATMDPFGVHDQGFRTARRLKPWGVDNGVDATADPTESHPDPCGTDDLLSRTRMYEKPTGRRPIRPMGVEDVATANVNDVTNRPAPYGTEEVRFEAYTAENSADAHRLQPHQVDDVMRLR